MTDESMERVEVGIVGGGVIGLGIAGALAPHFDSVVLFDKNYSCRKASHAAGGMLAPFMEVEYGERDLFKLNRQSLREYPDFVRRLERETDSPVGFREEGSLFVAVDDRQASELNRLVQYQERLGLQPERLTSEQVLNLEPNLSESIQTAVLFPEEKHVNNRLLGLALTQRARNRGVSLRLNDPVDEIHYGNDGRIEHLSTRFSSVKVDQLIIAAGAWSAELPGLKPRDRLPIRSVKGEACSVQPGGDFDVRKIVRSPDFYGVPQSPERFIVGASTEEKGFNGGTKAGHIMNLLDASAQILPEIRTRPLLETWWGFRPATRNGKPIIGPSTVTDNLYFACGHFRNGILLTPITIQFMKKCLLEDEPPDAITPFLPSRFQKHQATQHHRSA